MLNAILSCFLDYIFKASCDTSARADSSKLRKFLRSIFLLRVRICELHVGLMVHHAHIDPLHTQFIGILSKSFLGILKLNTWILVWRLL